MAYFPMFVELEGRPCLIVGGGAVALRKARRLLPYGPCLTVVAQSFVPELEALEGAALCRRAFRPRDVEGQALVVAATGDGRAEPGDRRAVPGAAHPCERRWTTRTTVPSCSRRWCGAGRFPSASPQAGPAPRPRYM